MTENNSKIFHIKNYMRGKNCYFEFSELGEETVKRLIKSVCKDKQPGIDNIDDKPMSVLPVLSKILEKAVFDPIQDYVSLNNLISNYQHAF